MLFDVKMSDLVESCQSAYEKLRKLIYNDLVIVTGPPSVGKLTIVKRVFEENEQLMHAYVNCYTITTPTKFFSAICQCFLKELKRTGSSKPKGKLSCKTDQVSIHEFAKFYREISTKAGLKQAGKFYVVLDHVEAFRKTNLINCLTALISVRNLNIVMTTYETPTDVINYVTRVSKTAGSRLQDRMTPVVVSTWSVKDIVSWISSHPPKEHQELYAKFVKNYVSMAFQSDNRNPSQMLLLCQDNFPEFLKFYDEYTKEQYNKTHYMASDLDDSEEFDEESFEDFRQSQAFKATLVATFLKSFNKTVEQKTKSYTWTASDAEVKLPVNTSTLLIAAYFAAYTRPSDDKKNFVKLQKRTMSRARKDTSIDNSPKPFNLERLYHIYKALQRIRLGMESDDVVYDNGYVLGDVERLENLNILIHQTGWSVHPESRYKLSQCIKRDYINRLAKNVYLELDKMHGLASST